MATHAVLLSRSLSVNDCTRRDMSDHSDSMIPKGSVCDDLQRNSSSGSSSVGGCVGEPTSSSPLELTTPLVGSGSINKNSLNFPEKSGSKLRSRSIGNSVLWQGPARMARETAPRRKLFYLTRRLSKEKHKHQTLVRPNCLPAQVITSAWGTREEADYGSQEVTLNNSLNQRTTEMLLYTGLSQKYQPKSFQEIAGHKIIVQALSSAVEKKKIAPLYLFHGPNGTGKTSTARIFAMALNCESASHNKPCCSCKGCSRSLYVMELCSGSRVAGFEKIKTLLQSTSFTQAIPGLKVLIIEECHSITAEAWDELLSIVEGPYGSTLVFVLITLDANKVTGNISSRCQKFYFPKLKEEDITLKLTQILIHENVRIEREALKLIVAKSEGSLRDAENILDQLALLGSAINSSMVQQLVGLIPQHKLIDFLFTAFSGDTTKTLRYAKELITGVEPLALISQLATLITDILSGTSVVGTSSSSLSTGLSEDKRQLRRRAQLAKTQSAKLSYALKILVKTEKQLRSSSDQTSGMFSALLDITTEDASRRMSTGTVSPRNIDMPSGLITEPSIFVEGIDKSQRYISKPVPEKTNLANMSDMEKIWKDVLERIESRRTKEFLWQQVKLASISISRTSAIVHLIFRRPEEKMAAQISERSLAKALEIAIGCPVTVNMSLDPLGSQLMEENTILSESQLLGSKQQKFTEPSPRSFHCKNNKGQTSLITARESSPMSESLRNPKTKVCSTSQGQERSPSKGKEKTTIQPQPQRNASSLGHLTSETHLTTEDPERKILTQAQTATATTPTLRIKKHKHRWLSLSSIPPNDASVEPYSHDVLYENACKEREKVRKNPMVHKGFSKAMEDYHSHRAATQLQLKTSWGCIDICCSRNTQI